MTVIKERIFYLFLGLFAGTVAFFFWDGGHEALAKARQSWRSALENRVIEIYERTSPAVVFVSATSDPIDAFEFYAGANRVEGTGSGVVIDSRRGILLTSLHVIESALRNPPSRQSIKVWLADESSHRANVIGFDEQHDLAVLQVNPVPKGLVAVELGESGELRVGQSVLVIGNPHGLDRSLTNGIVSSLNRSVRNPNNFLMRGLIQTDAAINPGNSGGPLLDLDGRLIGINTAILSRSGDSAGIGFAIPVNQIKQVLPELIQFGSIRRPVFGWALIDTDLGPTIQRVFSSTPAAAAGVEPLERPVRSAFLQGFIRDFERADVIVSVNGVSVNTKAEVERELSKLKPNQKVTFELALGGDSSRRRSVPIQPEWR